MFYNNLNPKQKQCDYGLVWQESWACLTRAPIPIHFNILKIRINAGISEELLHYCWK